VPLLSPASRGCASLLQLRRWQLSEAAAAKPDAPGAPASRRDITLTLPGYGYVTN